MKTLVFICNKICNFFYPLSNLECWLPHGTINSNCIPQLGTLCCNLGKDSEISSNQAFVSLSMILSWKGDAVCVSLDSLAPAKSPLSAAPDDVFDDPYAPPLAALFPALTLQCFLHFSLPSRLQNSELLYRLPGYTFSHSLRNSR